MRSGTVTIVLAILLALVLSSCGDQPSTTSPSGEASPVATGKPASTGSADEPSSTPDASVPATPAPTTNSSASPASTGSRWVKAGRFRDDRMLTHLVVLGTGEVLAVGDDPECGIASNGSDSAEVGDPAGRTWTVVEPMSSRRNQPTVVGLADGRALVTGGASGEDEGYIAKSSTLVFSPRTRKWARSGLLNTARIDASAVGLRDGRALIAGGLYLDGRNQGRALDTAETWDPNTGVWTRTAGMVSRRIGANTVQLRDGRVLVVGGLPGWGSEEALASAELFDPATGDWTEAGALETARHGFSLVALDDGSAIALGGIGNRGNGGEMKPVPTVERFDPASGTWTVMDSLAVPSGDAALLSDGRVFVLSGGTVRIVDPARGLVSKGPRLPGGRGDAAIALLHDGSVVVGGGWSTPADPMSTPSCAEADRQAWRFIPG